mgnify:FL=1
MLLSLVGAPLNFGPFSLDIAEARLTRHGEVVPLSPRPFDLLAALASRPGKLITREELLREVWKGTAVEPSSLKAAMSVLRQALGEDAERVIETVPGRGYRFIAPLEATSTTPAEDSVQGTASPRARVVLVDDHEIVRIGARVVVEQCGMEVAGDAGTITAADRLIEAERPDLVILDLMIGDEPSLSHIGRWRSAVPGLRVIMLSMHHEDEYARRALQAGASGYVMKATMVRELGSAIDAVAAGHLWVSASVTQSIVREFATR